MNNPDILSEALSITFVGYGIVFAVLLVLYIVFSYMSKLIAYQADVRYKRANKVKASEDNLSSDTTKSTGISGEVSAAISLALHLHFNEQHDVESGKLTVKRVSKRYTPWNSKIYNVINRL